MNKTTRSISDEEIKLFLEKKLKTNINNLVHIQEGKHSEVFSFSDNQRDGDSRCQEI